MKDNNVEQRVCEAKEKSKESVTRTGTFWSFGLIAWLGGIALFLTAAFIYFKNYRKKMRKINYLVIHCTSTQPDADIKNIQNFWKKNLGCKSPGYHYIIKADGEIVHLILIDKISNGVAGWNSQIINISGTDKKGILNETQTPEQKVSLLKVLKDLKKTISKCKKFSVTEIS